ncbi:hypothetical protein D3C78_1897770 [compost metagenome]
MACENPRRVTTDAEEGSMAERDQATEAKRQIETRCRQRQDGYTGCEGDVEGLAKRICRKRHGEQQGGQNEIDEVFAV